ncbi:hypothetical protein BDY21DRAFT_340484 [Lineolata rhizophorae]|uniref:Methyltransferase domain-containing protein n=1 Tax=Lineolata rhizophorae TaxID=578093 RepID=A0A6A6P4Z9_9PEZI|nr:hypothetical protein BDY21DRAFT_340484 [Lineolata rhizophorae]
MAAYHNPHWPEAYDLWVEHLFGPGPYEDAAVFRNAFHGIIRARGTRREEQETPATNEPIAVFDLGTGTGRVVQDLLAGISRESEGGSGLSNAVGAPVFAWPLRFIGVEPSGPMLSRAERRTAPLVARVRQLADDAKTRLDVAWLRGEASDFADRAESKAAELSILHDGGGIVDLVIFAAGGFGHLVDDAEVKAFLEQARKALKRNGRVTVSILHEFLVEEDELDEAQTVGSILEANRAGAGVGSGDAEPIRLKSLDHPGIAYVRYPSKKSWDGEVQRDEFELGVVDQNGNELYHELEWKNRITSARQWSELVSAAELKILERIEGTIQTWWVLERK